jgi:hypothetical protein
MGMIIRCERRKKMPSCSSLRYSWSCLEALGKMKKSQTIWFGFSNETETRHFPHENDKRHHYCCDNRWILLFRLYIWFQTVIREIIALIVGEMFPAFLETVTSTYLRQIIANIWETSHRKLWRPRRLNRSFEKWTQNGNSQEDTKEKKPYQDIVETLNTS